MKRRRSSKTKSISEAKSRKQLESFTCNQLKDYLEKRKMKKSGIKEFLIDRVYDHLKKIEKETAIQRKIDKVIARFDSPCNRKKSMTAIEIHNKIGEFALTPPEDLTTSQLYEALKILSRTSAFVMTGATGKIVDEIMTFHRNFTDFVSKFPVLKKILDPHYIVFDFLNVTPEGEQDEERDLAIQLPPDWDDYLLRVPSTVMGQDEDSPNILPVETPGQPVEYFYRVQSEGNEEAIARHFGGVMQGAIPGLHFWLLSSNFPILYF